MRRSYESSEGNITPPLTPVGGGAVGGIGNMGAGGFKTAFDPFTAGRGASPLGSQVIISQIIIRSQVIISCGLASQVIIASSGSLVIISCGL